MKRAISMWGGLLLALAVFLGLAPVAAAQDTGRLTGIVLDFDAKPWPDVIVEMKKADTGLTFTVKTGKDGRYSQVGLSGGPYTITFKARDRANYVIQFPVQAGQENTLDVNFKEIQANQGKEVADAKKKQEEEEKSYQGMKEHFESGVAAMNDASQLRAQLASTPADQRGPIQDKLKADYQTAITEFQQAEHASAPKEVGNHAKALSNLGTAYESAGNYAEAADAFQKAIDLKPTEASYFGGLGTNLARLGKMPEASAACDKVAALDPTTAGVCWRNVGIVLSNAGKMKEAAEPLKKGTQADPKNADGWYLLGAALVSQMQSKQEGDKLILIPLPGTVEAYQKYLELAPNGPHAGEVKEMIATLAASSEGVETRVSTKKKK